MVDEVYSDYEYEYREEEQIIENGKFIEIPKVVTVEEPYNEPQIKEEQVKQYK